MSKHNGFDQRLPTDTAKIFDGKKLYEGQITVEQEGWYGLNNEYFGKWAIELEYKKKGDKLFDKYRYQLKYRNLVVGPFKTERELIMEVDRLAENKKGLPDSWEDKFDDIDGDIIPYIVKRKLSIKKDKSDGQFHLMKENTLLNARIRDVVSLHFDEIEKIDIQSGPLSDKDIYKSVYVSGVKDYYVLEVMDKKGPHRKNKVYQFEKDFDSRKVGQFLESYARSKSPQKANGTENDQSKGKAARR
jgi:hypothetical protein